MEYRLKVAVGKDGKSITADAVFPGIAESVILFFPAGVFYINRILFYFSYFPPAGKIQFSSLAEFQMETLGIPMRKRVFASALQSSFTDIKEMQK